MLCYGVSVTADPEDIIILGLSSALACILQFLNLYLVEEIQSLPDVCYLAQQTRQIPTDPVFFNS